MHEIVTYLPTSDLHFIPSVLSEIVLGCKESNEKARSAAFTLLLHSAQRIVDPERNPVGTVICNRLAPHMADDSPDAPATIEEFFTMVSAGLAGSSPHMVAASITALSRLLFEFHYQLPPADLTDLVHTLDLFLTSNNREIVRSVLGFAKVAAVVLPEDILRPRLDSLVPNLMVWSKEHKGRLKSKVKGILDRLLRRFGSAVIEHLVGEADRKMVVAIRKERERRKRKKKGGREGDEGDDEGTGEGSRQRKSSSAPGERTFTNEFDKALYGSDMSDSDFDTSNSDDASEIDVDGAGHTQRRQSRDKYKGRQKSTASGRSRGQDPGDGNQYIRELSPESNPLDLLAPSALASISTTKPRIRFLAPKKKPLSARVDADGKLLIGGGHSEDVTMTGGAGDEGASVNAYISAVSGPDAVRRGQRGRLKVSQGGFGKRKNVGGDEMDLDDEGETTGSAAIRKEMKNVVGKSGRRGLGMLKVKGSGSGVSGSGRIQKKMRDGTGRHGFRVGARGRVRRI
jgi:ribosomal RNA-processing protein 12